VTTGRFAADGADKPAIRFVTCDSTPADRDEQQKTPAQHARRL